MLMSEQSSYEKLNANIKGHRYVHGQRIQKTIQDNSLKNTFLFCFWFLMIRDPLINQYNTVYIIGATLTVKYELWWENRHSVIENDEK